MRRFSAAVLALSLVSAFTIAAPIEQFGMKPGTIHRMALGGGEINARVVEIGKDGWVLFSVESNDVRWMAGTKLWINLDRINNISMPIASAGPVAGTTALNEAEIAALPCFPQTDYRDAQASAKGQPFDRTRFLTECISSQRKK